MMKPSEEQIGVAAPVDRIVRQDVAEKLNEYLSVEDRLKRIEQWITREEEWHDRLDALSERNEAETQDECIARLREKRLASASA